MNAQAIRQVSEMLAEWLGVDGKDISRREPQSQAADAVVEVGKHVVVVEIKSSGAAAAVSEAAKRVRDYAALLSKRAIPIVVVPYMGEVGRRLCEEAGVQWLDLSRNAHIVALGVRILIEG